MNRFFLILAGVLFLCFEAFGAEIVIKFSHVVSEQSPKGKAALYLKNLVEKKSNGRIEIQIFPRGILFDDITVVEALKKNIVQLAAPSFSKLSFYESDFQVFDMPYIFENLSDVHRTYFGKIGDILSDKSLDKGIKVLAFWDNGFKNITNNKKVIKHPLDMAGMKFRIMGGDILSYQFILSGAKPYTKSFSNLGNILSEGVLDGQENTFSNIYYQRLFSYQKFLTVSRHGYLGYGLITSSRFWDSLSETDRKLLEECMADATFYEYEVAEKDNVDSFNMLKINNDIDIYELSVDETVRWKDFYRSHMDIFVRGISKQIIDEVEKL